MAVVYVEKIQSFKPVFVCFLDTWEKQVTENHCKGEKLHHAKANHFAGPPIKGTDLLNNSLDLSTDYINNI